jgi:signal transduction histidine kinase/sensor domain CHASE-containing protein/ActR/RegA family two-component response regulator
MRSVRKKFEQLSRFLPSLLVVLAGVALSIVLLTVLRARAEADKRTEFKWESTLHTAALQQSIDHLIEQVDATGRLFDSMPGVARRNFKEFVAEPLGHHPDVKYLAWVPRVAGSQRAVFENAVRQEGMVDFRISERLSAGTLSPARQRDEYYPIYYLEPREGNEAELGLDLLSEEAQRQSLLKARDTGEKVTSQRIRIVAAQEEHGVFLVLRPVYRGEGTAITAEERRENIEGFILGVSCISDFAKEALEKAKAEHATVRIYDDEAPTGGTTLLYDSEEAPQHGTYGSARAPSAPVPSRMSATSSLQLPGRTWRILFEPNATFYGEHRTAQVWIIFAASLLITLLISLNMARMARRNARISGLAAQLSLTNQELRAKILEREQAENALQESEEKVRQMQKMEAIGQLAGGIAHDFNNILMVILGYSDILLAKLGVDNPLCEHLRTIKTAALRAADLTRQLLAFSRKQMLQPRVADLNELIRDGEKMLRRLIREDIALIFTLSREAAHVKVDPSQLSQIMMNLAVNARDAMPQGGKLIIETKTLDFTAHTATGHGELQPGRYAMISVSDTGIGMDDAIKSHLFEPFFTTKDLGKGTGLGLATIYGIVKQSGGYIYAYSELGTGTTFKIYLPCTDTAPTVDRGQRGEQDQILGGTETILLAEDEAELRSLTRVILEKNGYTVIEAEDGEAAVRKCGELGSGGIHAMVTDVVMPRMGGKEAVQQIRKICPNLAVLFMTGYTEDFIALNEMLEDGMVILQKPLRAEDLLRQLRKSLDGVAWPMKQGE